MHDWTNRSATRPAARRCACGLMTVATVIAVIVTPQHSRADVSEMLGLNAGARAAAIQPDGKIVAAGYTYANDAATPAEQARDLLVTRTNVDGSADSTFGVLGVVVMDLGSDFEGLSDVEIQADGKIVAGGSSNGTVAIIRLETDGTLDAGFGSGGVASGSPGSAGRIAIQDDGRIIAANGGFIYRFLPDGTPDSSFGNGGETILSYFFTTDLAIRADDKIVLGGYEVLSNKLKTVRLESDGDIDTFYGTGGVSTIDGNYRPGGLAIDATGRILLSAYVEAQPEQDYPVVARFLPSGSPDSTFDGDGLAAFPGLASTRTPHSSDIALQSDGQIVVAGDCTETFRLFRMNDDGSLDPTYDGDGVHQADLGGNLGVPNEGGACALAMAPGDKAVSVGSLKHGTNTTVAVVRATTSGALDTDFDVDGFFVESDCRRFPLPVPACRPAGRSMLKFAGGVANRRISLGWKWAGADAFAHADLGTPGTGTRFTLCVYDMTAGMPRLATWLDLYGDAAGWVEDAPNGWQYDDGGPDTIETLRLKASTSGSNRVSMRADGYSYLPLPDPVSPEAWFDKDPSVLVQFVSSDGLCLQTEYPADSVKRDDGVKFKAAAR